MHQEGVKEYSLREIGKALEDRGFELKSEVYSWERDSLVRYEKRDDFRLNVTLEAGVILHTDGLPTFAANELVLRASIERNDKSGCSHLYQWQLRGAERIISAIPLVEVNLKAVWSAATLLMDDGS